MKLIEIRDRTDQELQALEAQLREDSHRLHVQKATNQLENTSTLCAMRRDLARVKTIQRAREQGLEESRQQRK